MCNSFCTITVAESAYTHPPGCFLAAKTFCQRDPEKTVLATVGAAGRAKVAGPCFRWARPCPLDGREASRRGGAPSWSRGFAAAYPRREVRVTGTFTIGDSG